MKRALVIRVGGIGDALMASSIFPGLVDQGYEVHVDTSPIGEEALRNDPHVRAFLVTPLGVVPKEKTLDHWRARSLGYQKVVNLMESCENALLTIPSQSAFYWDHEARHRLFNGSYLEYQHAVAGVPMPARQRFYPSEEEAKRAAEVCAGGPVVLYCLAGSHFHKIWPYAREYVSRLLDLSDARIVLSGGPRDKNMVAEIYTYLTGAGQDHARVIDGTKFALRDTLALATVADVVVGPETGVMHAAAFEANAKVLLLSHSSRQNLETGWRNTEFLEPSGLGCFPCHRLHLVDGFCNREVADGVAACAKMIGVGAVLGATMKALGASKA